MLRELRTTLALAVPIIAGHLGQILLGLTDSVMIGRLGTVPLAAAALGSGIFNFVYITSIGLLTAVSVRAAFAQGARQPREAGRVLRHGLIIAGVASAALALSIDLASRRLQWLGQPPEVAAAAQPFLAVLSWSLVPGLLFLALKNYYEALNRPWVPMAWVFIGLVLNVVLNWILLYGHLGSPALGLVGSGLATLISRIVILAGLLWHFSQDPGLARTHPARWLARPSWGELRAQVAQGLPVSAQLFFEAGLFTVAGIFMGWLGTVPLAAHQVALTCASTTFMVPLGLSIALSVRLGQARGSGEAQRLRTIGNGGIAAGLVFMAGTACVFLTLGHPIASLFIHDPAVIALATQLLVIAGIFQLFDGTQVTCSGALRGLADIRVPAVLTFVGYWLLALPAAWLGGFALHFGATGIWAGLALGLGVCASLLLWRFRAQTRPRVLA